MFSKADNNMNEECFQFASLCGKYTYIGDLYLQFFFDIALHSIEYWGCHFG